jgi:hypothetical protein
MDFKRQVLLEVSAVPVPSNPNALHQARGKGIDIGPIVAWAETVRDQSHELWLPQHDDKVEVLLDSVAGEKMICDLARGLKDANGKTSPGAVLIEDPEQAQATIDAIRSGHVIVGDGALSRDVISYAAAHSDGTPLADEDADWDGPAELAAAGVEDLKVMCAWRAELDDDEDPTKGDYKLPHHKADGEHACVWRAVAAAMASILGARGGVDIPDGDRRGVYDHLAKHYAEFDREPPEFKSIDEPAEVKGSESTPEPEPESDALSAEHIEKMYSASIDAAKKAEGALVEQLCRTVAILAKQGRVLSSVNEDKLREARDLLSQVLQAVEPEDGDESKNIETMCGSSVDEEQLRAIVAEALDVQLAPLTGRLAR